MTATKATLIAEKYYAKLWMGKGAPSLTFEDPSAKTVNYTAPVVASGYEAYTTTDDYIDAYVSSRRPGASMGSFYEVTAENASSLSITPGTTHAYAYAGLESSVDVSGFSAKSDYVGKYLFVAATPALATVQLTG